MKNPLILYIAFTLCMLLNIHCGKDDPVNPNNQQPLVTPVGSPTGIPSSTSIDASGGTLTSTDGVLKLTIPAGAVSSTTIFSIQPLSNNCPGGAGSAYRLSPEGLTFAQPVTILFNYADSIVANENYLAIAYQDVDHTWFAPKIISSTASVNQISVQTKHFSDWSIFERLSISPHKASVFINENVTLKITFVGTLNSITNSQGIELNNLNIDNLVSTTWHADAGNIEKMGDDKAKYTAPSTVPSDNPVDVSVKFNNVSFTINGNTVTDPTLHALINVFGDEKYFMIDFSSSRTLQQVGDNFFTETDHGNLKVLLQGDSVTVYAVKNFVAEITPGSLYDVGPECNHEILNPGDGPFNTPDSVKLGGFSNPITHEIYIGIISANFPTGRTPLIQTTCTGSSPLTEGGDLQTTLPSSFSFNPNLPYQENIVVISGGGVIPDGFLKTTVTKIQ
ncbi:MAG: hypothetical protein IPP15_16365 [Saprospiraceae bacterium]|uniref:ZU5 domain-containing protein n=1 Tax=Candidatus Opimibacter skivensis TaxID=2982028 RepID=A0A9D7T019_9BACT|nr:hypothetical protein [Candidatus Opimibacter skivensis]